MDVLMGLGLLAALIVGVAIGWAAKTRQARPHNSVIRVPPRARALLKGLPHGIAVASADGKTLFLNDRARELAIADSTGTLPAPLREAIGQAIRHGDPVDVNLEVTRRHSRSVVPLLATVVAVENEQDLAVVSVFDAGSPLATRIARREFVVNVSHELKTPIGAISLMAEALDSAAANPDKVREFGARIRTESARLAHLVQQFIELSRVQGSETVIEPSLLDIRECIDAAAEGVRGLAADRGITIDLAGSMHAPLRCERRTVTMAVRNLMENAVRYSPPQSRVAVVVSQREDALAVAVMDQGIGIAEHDRERIFERFFRADEARDRESGGTGIGLAIVKHVMRQHGGSVEVWSEVGVGSTLTLVFPIAGTD